VDKTGSGSSPIAGFGINGVKSSGSATKENNLVRYFKIVRNCKYERELRWLILNYFL
jgi:hypothetical protein